MWLPTACSSRSNSQTLPAVIAEPQQIQTAIASADQLFKQREEVSNLQQAVAQLSRVRDPNDRNYEVEWKFAKYSYFLGLHSKDPKESESSFTDGRDAGKIASNMEPQKADGYFWFGANLGELCKRSPVTVGLQSVGDVQDAMKKVIEIDPKYQGSSAYDALAQIELGTRLKGGSVDKAIEYLEKAISIENDNTNLHLHLAEAYLAANKDADAKKQIDILLSMKPNPDYIPEHKESVEAAKKLLQSKF